MRPLIVAALMLLFAAPAWASDCSTIKIMENGGGKISPFQIATLARFDDMHCVDMSKLKVVEAGGQMRAAVVVKDATLFSTGGANPFMILVKGTGYGEGEPLPQGEYRYLGVARLTKANGFPLDLPAFERK